MSSHEGSTRRLLCLLPLVGAAACATTPAYDYAKERDPRKQEFVIGPSDVLRISVWKAPELSTDATVRPDGVITVPLVGDVHAGGRTPAQVRTEIAGRLSTYIKDETMTVTVAVAAVNSYKFTVNGNVEKPGVYTAGHFVTVTEALALAGGPNRFAALERIVVVRQDQAGGPPRRIPVSYTAIVSGARPEQDIALVAGDTVTVP